MMTEREMTWSEAGGPATMRELLRIRPAGDGALPAFESQDGQEDALRAELERLPHPGCTLTFWRDAVARAWVVRHGSAANPAMAGPEEEVLVLEDRVDWRSLMTWTPDAPWSTSAVRQPQVAEWLRRVHEDEGRESADAGGR